MHLNISGKYFEENLSQEFKRRQDDEEAGEEESLILKCCVNVDKRHEKTKNYVIKNHHHDFI